MEELGRRAAEKAAKGVWGKVKGALGVGEAEIEVSDKGIKARAPSIEKAKELLDYGVETLLKLPQTRELLSKADKKELENPMVRSREIKRDEDAQRLVEAPKVKALSEKEKLQFSTFAFIAYGDESFHSGIFSEAEKAYRRAYDFAQKVKDKPLQAICLNLIGAAMGGEGKLEEALTLLDEAIKLKPDFGEAWVNKGVALGNLGRYEVELACYDEAIKLKPDLAEAWYNKGVALGEHGQHKEALACYDKAIKLKPDYAEAWNNKGATLCDELNQIQEAIACFDRALRAKPVLAETWHSKGVAFYKLGQRKEALSCLDEAIKLKPNDAEAWEKKGVALYELGQLQEAIICFDEVVKLRPDHAEIRVDKGVTLAELGQLQEALACYDEAIKLKPDFVEAWNNKGMTLGELGQPEEALTCLDKALKLAPNDFEAWYGKGMALGELRRPEEALACYDETIKLKPDFAEAWNNKGAVICDELGEFNEAIVCFDQALNLDPALIEPWIGRGVALENLKRVEEAKTSLKKAFSLSEKMPDKRFMALGYLTQFILKQGLEDIASPDMKRAEKRTLELIKLKDEAEKDGMARTVEGVMAKFKEGLSEKDLKSFKGFEEILRRFEARRL